MAVVPEPVPIVSDVFRFVTLRNPIKPTTTSTSSTSSGAKIVYLESSEALLHQQIKTIVQSSNTNTVKLTDLQDKLSAYKLSTDYVPNMQYLYNKTPLTAHQDLANWIHQNPQFDATQLSDQIHHLGLDDTNNHLSEAQKKVIWANLLLHYILGGFELVENLQLLLRLDNLVTQHVVNTLNDVDTLKALSKASVVLHHSVFPLPTLQKEPPKIVDNTEKKNLVLKYKAYQQVVADLQNWYEAQLAVQPNENTPIKIGILDTATLANFAETITTALTELQIPANVPVQFAIKQLQKAINKVLSKLKKYTQPKQSVVQLGGAWLLKNKQAPKLAALQQPPPNPYAGYNGFYTNELPCEIKPLGIGDLRLVRQALLCYEPGEIAHIENVLKGELKERTTRRLQRVEETFTTTTETEQETERDTQSTDRYELQKETSNIISEDSSFDIGVSIAAHYGPVSGSVNTNFATSNAQTQSNSTASNYAKEVTARAVERIMKRVSEQRTRKIIEEFEETTKHTIDNLTAGAEKNMSGIYRWINKRYCNTLINYGKRLMFEFIVPEPAAFHIEAYTQTNNTPGSTALVLPIAPNTNDTQELETLTELGLEPLVDFNDITEDNYALWAAFYGAAVEAPLPAQQIISRGFSYASPDQDGGAFAKTEEITIPEGYYTLWYNLYRKPDHAIAGTGQVCNVLFELDYMPMQYSSATPPVFTPYSPDFGTLNPITNKLPITIYGEGIQYYAVHVNITCQQTQASINQWKMNTFQAIWDAYNIQKADYDNAIASIATQGIFISGNNPQQNRQTEQTELKRGCIEQIIRDIVDIPPPDPDTEPVNETPWAQDTYGGTNDNGVPQYNTCLANKLGNRVKFTEEAFDWDFMAYFFYPYFWAHQSRWTELYRRDDTDTQFLNFLKAGYARVVIPVKPGYEKRAMHFLSNGGTIVPEGNLPVLPAEIYTNILDDLAQNYDTEVMLTEQIWQSVVPTNLVVMHCQSACLDIEGLPCFDLPCEPRKPTEAS